VEDIDRPLYRVGDFVACDYEAMMIFNYTYDQKNLYYYGIVVQVDATYHQFMEEYVYEVLCLDGEKRFFMESELILV
jgi:hypothetical protein